MSRLGLKTEKPDSTAYDLIYGLASGIPLCCVYWYVNAWSKLDHGEWHNNQFGYIPCPSCLSLILSGEINPAKIIHDKKIKNLKTIKNIYRRSARS